MIIRLLRAEDAAQVAKIHRQSIHTGFMSSLSPSFLESLYNAIARTQNAFGFVCEKEGAIGGFICITKNTKQLFKELILKWGFVLMVPLLKHLFNFSVVKKILNNILYPNKFNGDLPKAEILSVAVDVTAQGLGIGKELMAAAVKELKKQHISQVKALTDDANSASNLYYKKNGFVFVDKIPHHDHFLNIYVLTIPQAAKK